MRLLAVAIALALGATASALGGPLSDLDRDAIARVAVAEAGNHGDSGLAAVIEVIFNRLASGRWGASVDAVINAPHQFEPVMRAGGDWRRLRPVTPVERARVDTILGLIADGRLPDFIGAAQYFQNPRIVADRIAARQAPPSRLNFGGQSPVAVVGDHAFFVRGAGPIDGARTKPGDIFVNAPREGGQVRVEGGGQGLFILPDGSRALEGAVASRPQGAP